MKKNYITKILIENSTFVPYRFYNLSIFSTKHANLSYTSAICYNRVKFSMYRYSHHLFSIRFIHIFLLEHPISCLKGNSLSHKINELDIFTPNGLHDCISCMLGCQYNKYMKYKFRIIKRRDYGSILPDFCFVLWDCYE